MSNLVIPRIFHRIWLGRRPMPAEFQHYGQSWLNHHPGWKMNLWNEKNMIPLHNQDLYNSASSAVQKADIASYEILHNFGGIYLDCDFECLRNIEGLLNNVEAFAASEQPGVISHGIMGCVPGHPVFKKLVDSLRNSFYAYQHLNYVHQTGPIYISNTVGGRSDFLVFAPEFFYPYHWQEKHRKGEYFPNAYAVHHWAGSWLNKSILYPNHNGPRNIRYSGARRVKIVNPGKR